MNLPDICQGHPGSRQKVTRISIGIYIICLLVEWGKRTSIKTFKLLPRKQMPRDNPKEL